MRKSGIRNFCSAEFRQYNDIRSQIFEALTRDKIEIFDAVQYVRAHEKDAAIGILHDRL